MRGVLRPEVRADWIILAGSPYCHHYENSQRHGRFRRQRVAIAPLPICLSLARRNLVITEKLMR